MCGIAAVISGIQIIGSNLSRKTKEASPLEAKKDYGSVLVTIDNLKSALQRRGPDSLGCRNVLIQSECENLVKKCETTCTKDVSVSGMNSTAQVHFIGAMLQLRGLNPVSQPLEDASGNLLVYN
ncbi:uncharacterized protein LOC110035114, partial [Phalaenopsis equestris]|uniref:uncharacterized protein LOC110035114 n=1 Tax=Phalaenopsis equestris TaxID=78828 RepID=UPI0009E31468